MSRKFKRDTKTQQSPPGDRLNEVAFSYESPTAHKVYLAGDFNNWSFDTLLMTRDDKGVWRARVRLAPGSHEYRFIVDGDWQNDPNACGVVPNEFGSCNCVCEVA